jgi:integrase/recombinase XerD
MKKQTFTSCLGNTIKRYLQMMEALGRRFASERRVLELLDDFMTERKARDFRQEHFDSWCSTLMHLASTVRRDRMRIVRNFCLYRCRSRPDRFVPNAALFPSPQPAHPSILVL